jgi:undecaprenyl-diphosphatase
MGFAPLVYVWVGAIVIGLFAAGLRWDAATAMFAAAGVAVAGELIKELAHRARPTADLFRVTSEVTGFSFPSGHVLLYTSFCGFLLFLVFTLAPPSVWRSLGMVVLGGMIALIGMSRVYLGHHFPSDVLGAYLLGSLWLALTIWIYRWGKKRWAAIK